MCHVYIKITSKPVPIEEAIMRRIIVRQRSRWTVDEWEGGWDLAMTRIDRVPTLVEAEPIFQDCLTVLDWAFVDGNRLRFELGLGALIDFCTETVNKGDCEQWWK
jgi:hypothetical protein